jgi:hypothetical protein
VNRSAPNSTRLSSCQEVFPPRVRLGIFICGLLVAFLFAGLAPVAVAQKAPLPSARPDLPFAVSDFDGDLRPDLAVVQAGRSNPSFTDYWVQLQLSAAGLKYIRLVAPTGGLQIAARDVNGDLFPDLVLTTAWRDQPVAILLNDGHGSFSLIDPAVFPEAFHTCNSNWSGSDSGEQDLLGVVTQSPPVAGPAAARLPHLGSSVRATRPANCGFLTTPVLISCQGRAPPFEFPRL